MLGDFIARFDKPSAFTDVNEHRALHQEHPIESAQRLEDASSFEDRSDGHGDGIIPTLIGKSSSKAFLGSGRSFIEIGRAIVWMLPIVAGLAVLGVAIETLFPSLLPLEAWLTFLR